MAALKRAKGMVDGGAVSRPMKDDGVVLGEMDGWT